MSTIVNSTSSAAPRAVNRGRFALVGLATVVAAVAANALVYVIGSAVVGYDPTFLILATIDGTIVFTLPAAIVAVLIYGLLLRFSANPERLFTRIAAVVLVISWIPDLLYIPTVPGSSTAQIAVLMLMHLVAAVVIVGILTRFAQPQSGS